MEVICGYGEDLLGGDEGNQSGSSEETYMASEVTAPTPEQATFLQEKGPRSPTPQLINDDAGDNEDNEERDKNDFVTPQRSAGRRHSSFASNVLSSIGNECQRQSRKYSANVLGGSETCLSISSDRHHPDPETYLASPLSSRRQGSVAILTPGPEDVKTPRSARRSGNLMRRSASIAFSKGRKLSGLLANSLPRRFVLMSFFYLLLITCNNYKGKSWYRGKNCKRFHHGLS